MQLQVYDPSAAVMVPTIGGAESDGIWRRVQELQKHPSAQALQELRTMGVHFQSDSPFVLECQWEAQEAECFTKYSILAALRLAFPSKPCDKQELWRSRIDRVIELSGVDVSSKKFTITLFHSLIVEKREPCCDRIKILDYFVTKGLVLDHRLPFNNCNRYIAKKDGHMWPTLFLVAAYHHDKELLDYLIVRPDVDKKATFLDCSAIHAFIQGIRYWGTDHDLKLLEQEKRDAFVFEMLVKSIPDFGLRGVVHPSPEMAVVYARYSGFGDIGEMSLVDEMLWHTLEAGLMLNLDGVFIRSLKGEFLPCDDATFETRMLPIYLRWQLRIAEAVGRTSTHPLPRLLFQRVLTTRILEARKLGQPDRENLLRSMRKLASEPEPINELQEAELDKAPIVDAHEDILFGKDKKWAGFSDVYGVRFHVAEGYFGESPEDLCQ
jgi:hypothetical protein